MVVESAKSSKEKLSFVANDQSSHGGVQWMKKIERKDEIRVDFMI